MAIPTVWCWTMLQMQWDHNWEAEAILVYPILTPATCNSGHATYLYCLSSK